MMKAIIQFSIIWYANFNHRGESLILCIDYFHYLYIINLSDKMLGELYYITQ